MNKHIPTLAATAALLSAIGLACAQNSQAPTAVPPTPPASATGDVTTVTQPSGSNAAANSSTADMRNSSDTSSDSSRVPQADRN